MLWYSQQDSKPNFIWRSDRFPRAEWLFLAESGRTAGAARHLGEVQQSQLAVRNLRDDVVANFEIDGEVLDPARVASALRRRLGLAFGSDDDEAVEMGAAALAAVVLRDEDARVDEDFFFGWRDKFAASLFPGAANAEPDAATRRELRSFFQWYAEAPGKDDAPLLAAGLAHVWLESINPFGAATGVIGRALTERLLMLSAPKRNFVPLSLALCKYRHEYHRILDEACRDRDASRWLPWFAAAVVEAGRVGRARLDFAVNWRELMLRLEGRLSGRQRQLLRRLFRSGHFRTADTTAEEYALAETIGRREAQRELSALVESDALIRVKTGSEFRYRLNVPPILVARVYPEDVI